MTTELEVGLYIFMLAGFLGYHVITRVPPLLHTPLMSATNAIAAISLVGSLVVAGSDYSDVPNGWVCVLLGFLAVTCSATNAVGGFLITDRMLRMFRTAEDRAREAAEAARLLGVGWRQALDLPDGAIENSLENRLKIVRILRQVRPRVVILPYWQARHPDHAIVATLGYEACFLSGLSKVETGAPPHRPFKIIYASLYADVRPTFVVDITRFIDQRHQALMAYKSQYANQQTGSALFVPEEEIRERTYAEARHYGLLAGVRFGEPFVQKEVGLVDDLTLLPVQSL